MNRFYFSTYLNGQVIFETLADKGTASWCLEITGIDASGYLFDGPITDCMTKSAQILSTELSKPGINVYPNPFTDKLYFEFSRETDAKCVIELFDVSGKKLDVVFDQSIEAGQNYKVEYSAVKISADLLFYRMQFDEEIITGKVVKK